MSCDILSLGVVGGKAEDLKHRVHKVIEIPPKKESD